MTITYLCSLTWLKLQLKRMSLRRRISDPDLTTVNAIIKKELRTSNSLKGYRAMWRHICSKYRISIKR